MICCIAIRIFFILQSVNLLHIYDGVCIHLSFIHLLCRYSLLVAFILCRANICVNFTIFCIHDISVSTQYTYLVRKYKCNFFCPRCEQERRSHQRLAVLQVPKQVQIKFIIAVNLHIYCLFICRLKVKYVSFILMLFFYTFDWLICNVLWGPSYGSLIYN